MCGGERLRHMPELAVPTAMENREALWSEWEVKQVKL